MGSRTKKKQKRSNVYKYMMERQAKKEIAATDFKLKYKNKCIYCGSKQNITLDHFIPLAQGGADNITNIVPACRDCNTQKADKSPFEFIDELREQNALPNLLLALQNELIQRHKKSFI